MHTVLELCILPESQLKSNSVRNFSENPPVLEFILNFFFCWQNFLKIAFKTLRTERKQHAKNEKNLPSESGNNAAGSFKFLNSLTRQGRQLRMIRGCTRERTRKTHGTFYLGPVHTYPDIFESANFSFWIQKNPRPHVAYSNRNHPSTRIRWYPDSL